MKQICTQEEGRAAPMRLKGSVHSCSETDAALRCGGEWVGVKAAQKGQQLVIRDMKWRNSEGLWWSSGE